MYSFRRILGFFFLFITATANGQLEDKKTTGRRFVRPDAVMQKNEKTVLPSLPDTYRMALYVETPGMYQKISKRSGLAANDGFVGRSMERMRNSFKENEANQPKENVENRKIIRNRFSARRERISNDNDSKLLDEDNHKDRFPNARSSMNVQNKPENIGSEYSPEFSDMNKRRYSKFRENKKHFRPIRKHRLQKEPVDSSKSSTALYDTIQPKSTFRPSTPEPQSTVTPILPKWFPTQSSKDITQSVSAITQYEKQVRTDFSKHNNKNLQQHTITRNNNLNNIPRRRIPQHHERYRFNKIVRMKPTLAIRNIDQNSDLLNDITLQALNSNDQHDNSKMRNSHLSNLHRDKKIVSSSHDFTKLTSSAPQSNKNWQPNEPRNPELAFGQFQRKNIQLPPTLKKDISHQQSQLAPNNGEQDRNQNNKMKSSDLILPHITGWKNNIARISEDRIDEKSHFRFDPLRKQINVDRSTYRNPKPESLFSPSGRNVVTKKYSEPTKIPGSDHLVRQENFPYRFWNPNESNNKRNDFFLPNEIVNDRKSHMEFPDNMFNAGLLGPVLVPDELAKNFYETKTAVPSFDLIDNPFEKQNQFSAFPEVHTSITTFHKQNDYNLLNHHEKNIEEQKNVIPLNMTDIQINNRATLKERVNSPKFITPEPRENQNVFDHTPKPTEAPNSHQGIIGQKRNPTSNIKDSSYRHVPSKLVDIHKNMINIPNMRISNPRPNLQARRPPFRSSLRVPLEKNRRRRRPPLRNREPFISDIQRRQRRPPAAQRFMNNRLRQRLPPPPPGHLHGPLSSGHPPSTHRFDLVEPYSSHIPRTIPNKTRSHFDVTYMAGEDSMTRLSNSHFSLNQIRRSSRAPALRPQLIQTTYPDYSIPGPHFESSVKNAHFTPELHMNRHPGPRREFRRPELPVEEPERQSFWSALRNLDFSILNPFNSNLFRNNYETHDEFDRLDPVSAAIPASVLLPGGLAVLGAGLGMFYFNYVWYPTPIVRARLVNMIMDGVESGMLSEDQEKTVSDVSRIYAALADIGSTIANVSDQTSYEEEVDIERNVQESLKLQDCKNRIVCQAYAEFEDLFTLTKGVTVMLKDQLQLLDQEMLVEYFEAADRGHHLLETDSTCAGYYQECPLAPVSIRQILGEMMGLNVDADNTLGEGGGTAG